MEFKNVLDSLKNGEIVKRSWWKTGVKYQGLKKNRESGNEFHSVIVVDLEGNFKAYGKITFNDALSDDWEVVTAVQKTEPEPKTALPEKDEDLTFNAIPDSTFKMEDNDIDDFMDSLQSSI